MTPENLSPDVITWVARVVLGTWFALSGAAKLRDLPGFVRGAEEYRLLRPLVVRPLARALPFVELALAAALISNVTSRPAAVGSIVLLSIFAAAVLVNLLRGRRIPCFCAGVASRQTIGWATVAKIAALAVAAALVAAGLAPETVSRTADVTPIAAWIPQLSIALSCLTALGLLGPVEVTFGSLQNARRLRRLKPRASALGSVATVQQSN